MVFQTDSLHLFPSTIRKPHVVFGKVRASFTQFVSFFLVCRSLRNEGRRPSRQDVATRYLWTAKARRRGAKKAMFDNNAGHACCGEKRAEQYLYRQVKNVRMQIFENFQSTKLSFFRIFSSDQNRNTADWNKENWLYVYNFPVSGHSSAHERVGVFLARSLSSCFFCSFNRMDLFAAYHFLPDPQGFYALSFLVLTTVGWREDLFYSSRACLSHWRPLP